MAKVNKSKLVLTHLQSKGSLTSNEAWNLYGVTRLAALIHNFRERGHIIDSVWEEGPDRYGNEVKWVRYEYKEV